MVLEHRLSSLRVGDDSESQLFSDNIATENDLFDITGAFRKLRSELQPDSIIKKPSFDLFEGTHSLEVNNRKLDTSLIALTAEEEEYDCNLAYGGTRQENLEYVTGIVDRLSRYVVCWLNDYQLLPTTILSCRYVEYLLVESAKTDKMFHLRTEDPLYDKVLCSAIYGICYFSKFVESLMKSGVVCPEEDLNFNNMGLDFLSYVHDPQQIQVPLNESLEYLEEFGDSACYLKHLLSLISSLVCIERCQTEYSADTSHLDKLSSEAQYLQKADNQFPYPSGCFSMGIQKRLSNQSPPKSLVIPAKNYGGYVMMVNDLKLALSVSKVKTTMELMQFARFFNKITQRHVIARAVFFSFVIRDDETVLGKYSLQDFAQLHPLEFSLASTEISKDLPEEINPILEDITNVLFDWYQNAAQNTSRYRQGYNRQLLLWDALQVQMENIEVEFESQLIQTKGNDFTLQPIEDMLPYTSWIFCMKITAMIEFILKGFDLEVYKPYESCTMFWYAYYLSFQLESCLEKVYKFVELKINKIVSLNKKMKKLKAGEKKETLRAQYRYLMNTEMKQLQVNRKFITFLVTECRIVKSLSLAQVFQFSILKSYNIIDNKLASTYHFTNEQLLYDLRMKVFSSIGVPEVVPYNLMQSTLDEFLFSEPMFSLKLNKAMECLHKEIQNALSSIDDVINCISKEREDCALYSATRLIKPQAIDYFERLKNSAQLIQLNSKLIVAKLGSNMSSSNVKSKYQVNLKFHEKASPFFPTIELSEEQGKKFYVTGQT